MACILVVADCEDGARMRLVLDEYVAAEDLATDGECSRLIERLGWAIIEAEELERDEHAPLDAALTPRGRSPRHRARGHADRNREERQSAKRPSRDSPAH